MRFSQDVADYRPTPRSLQTSKFGPYSRLDVERKSESKAWLWSIGYGIAIGITWWLIVAIKAGVQS